MAVPVIDIGIWQYFLPIFSFIFIFTLVFAILEKTKILGSDTTGLNSIIAFVMGLLFVLTPQAVAIVNFLVPWFIVIIFFILFIVVIFMFMGVPADTIREVAQGSAFTYTIVTVSIILLIIAIGIVWGEQLSGIYTEQQSGEGGSFAVTVGKILFHPKVLGAAFLLLIASQAMRLLSSRN